MALLFVPITVGIMPYFNVIQKNWVEVTLIMVISTIITYLVTAFIAEYILKKEDKKNA
jgi:holin-like protein